jgi:hypothetical protein
VHTPPKLRLLLQFAVCMWRASHHRLLCSGVHAIEPLNGMRGTITGATGGAGVVALPTSNSDCSCGVACMLMLVELSLYAWVSQFSAHVDRKQCLLA